MRALQSYTEPEILPTSKLPPITSCLLDLNPCRSRSIIAQAFNEAKEFCDKELKNDQKKIPLWLQGKSSAKDVLDSVMEAKRKYEPAQKVDGGWMSKANNIWSVASTRIVYYSNILDVLVQHHPEYVSLAWGALKFVFVVSHILFM